MDLNKLSAVEVQQLERREHFIHAAFLEALGKEGLGLDHDLLAQKVKGYLAAFKETAR